MIEGEFLNFFLADGLKLGAAWLKLVAPVVGIVPGVLVDDDVCVAGPGMLADGMRGIRQEEEENLSEVEGTGEGCGIVKEALADDIEQEVVEG